MTPNPYHIIVTLIQGPDMDSGNPRVTDLRSLCNFGAVIRQLWAKVSKNRHLSLVAARQ